MPDLVIRTRAITKVFRGKTAVRHVSLVMEMEPSTPF